MFGFGPTGSLPLATLPPDQRNVFISVALAFAGAVGSAAAYAWRPLRARALRVAHPFGPAARDRAGAAQPLIWPDHRAGSVVDYSIDVTLEAVTPDPIANVGVTIAGGPGLSLRALSWTGPVITASFAGGEPGTTYTITLAIVYASGRRDTRVAILTVI